MSIWDIKKLHCNKARNVLWEDEYEKVKIQYEKVKIVLWKRIKIESPSNSFNIISIEFKIQEWIKAKWILDDEFNWIGFETE